MTAPCSRYWKRIQSSSASACVEPTCAASCPASDGYVPSRPCRWRLIARSSRWRASHISRYIETNWSSARSGTEASSSTAPSASSICTRSSAVRPRAVRSSLTVSTGTETATITLLFGPIADEYPTGHNRFVVPHLSVCMGNTPTQQPFEGDSSDADESTAGASLWTNVVGAVHSFAAGVRRRLSVFSGLDFGRAFRLDEESF